MRRTRVLIVDDAVVVRRLVSQALAGEPSIEVAGTAPDGKIALEKIPQVSPDIVILDVEMPEMNGLQTLAALRRAWPDLPVIMFSRLTHRGAEVSVEALLLGASDCVAKPTRMSDSAEAVDRLRQELVPRVEALGRRSQGAPAESPRAPVAGPPDRRRVEAVAIGVSTGGPNALALLLSRLPASFPVPILIVQHMLPLFTRRLAERLDQIASVRVAEAANEEPIGPGGVWLSPGDVHLALERCRAEVRTRLLFTPPENSCRPSADVLFRSAAETFGDGVLAVVLTGMGRDGLRGCHAVRDAGGQILVQDEATSVVWGMPGFVARAGLADAVLPVDAIAEEILKRVEACRASEAVEAGAGSAPGAARN